MIAADALADGAWIQPRRPAYVAKKHLGRAVAEEAIAAALLQDMAVPLLAKELPDAYAELFEQVDADYAEFAPVLDMDAAAKTLTDYLSEAKS